MSSLQSFRKPRAVRPGDTVAIVAPAGPFDKAALEAGLAIISERYRVRYDEHIHSRVRYLAGDDNRRFLELTTALTSPDIKAVFCARGGYGATRLLPRLASWAAEERIPTKPLVGFSDITALHQWLQSNGIASIHAPVLTQLGRVPADSPKRLFALLESTGPAEPLMGTETYVGGTVEGPLLGGNLSVFTRLLGTPFMPPLDGAILLLEDLSEQPYRLDRMWTHLELAGVFRKIRGIVLGQFIGCEPREGDFTAAEVLRDLAAATGVPCASGFPIGHGDINEPVPLGVRVRLEADEARITFLEAAVGGA
ncbi:MAG: LD-carboxypeptidase family protein [Gammaproteobacteria bacterium]|nr:LD-carboxypeptidase family protein [Gammaproteobacteria bacterium]